MLTGTFVLPADVVVQPASDLPLQLHSIGAKEGDFALSRLNARAPSKIIDARAAALLQHFRNPTSIAKAVARFSRGESASPDQLLEEALPLLLSLMRSGILVPSDAPQAQPIEASMNAEGRVDRWSVMSCVQIMDDTEVYQVRAPGGPFGALKIGRADGPRIRSRLERELSVLMRLSFDGIPSLLDAGEYDSRRYIVLEWIHGVSPQVICSELRQDGSAESRRSLHGVCDALLRAYGALHERGVLHGDVHPRNVLVDRRGRVTILDFGLARFVESAAGTGETDRGGIGFFFEPELAVSILSGTKMTPASFAGEQFSIAALLYLLLTGSHYADFSLAQNEMLREIAEKPVLPFARRGIAPWPDAELILGRALSKRPEERFGSVAEFAEAWSRSKISRSRVSKKKERPLELPTISTKLLRDSSVGGELFEAESLPEPTASVNYGSAGLAYTLYRVACARDDSRLLALADVWSCRAIRDKERSGAFTVNELGLDHAALGPSSLYHGPAGVYALQAMTAGARGDYLTMGSAVDEFATICAMPCDALDVSLGLAGALLGSTFLLDAINGSGSPQREAIERTLRDVASGLTRRIWSTVDHYSPIGSSTDFSNLGVAHGWAGLLYATLSWCVASQTPVSDAVVRRLHELAERAEPAGRGLRWPWNHGDTKQRIRYMPGWCNGSAGFVFLWNAAYEATSDAGFLELADGAAWNVWESRSPNPNLCCGAAGQAYALLNNYRFSRSDIWLARAHQVAQHAAEMVLRLDDDSEPLEWRHGGLYKGDAVFAVLDADLSGPLEARMPLFEREV